MLEEPDPKPETKPDSQSSSPKIPKRPVPPTNPVPDSSAQKSLNPNDEERRPLIIKGN